MYRLSFLTRLRALLRRQSFEEDLAEELNTHIELQVRKHIAQGMDPLEARRLAHIEFGAVEGAREACREVDRWHWIDAAIRNGRHCFRSLAKNPAFAFISILILTVGIGANIAVFSTVDALLLRPLPLANSGRLVEIFSTDKQGHTGHLFSGALEELSHNPAFNGTCGVATHYEAVEIDGNLRNLGMAAFSGGCFQTLGLDVQLGRALTPDDDHLGAGRVAVITDSLWHSQFGGDSNVLGHRIRIGSDEFTIVGVTAKPFTGLLLGFPEPIMIPLLQQPDYTPDGSRRTVYYVNVLAQRAAGVSQTQALASLIAQQTRILEQSVPLHSTNAGRREYLSRSLALTSASRGFDYFLGRRFAQPLYGIFALCGAMLLSACINLASLLLARTLRRQREIGIRLALGAGRGHIVTIVVLEHVILVLAGTVLGIFAGLSAARTIVARAGQFLGNFDLPIGFDIRVVAFVIATLSIVIGVFVAVSLWQSRHVASADTLKQSGRGMIATNTRGQKILLAVQIALTLALVTGSALFTASVRNMYRINFGIQPQHVWIALLQPRPGGYVNPSYWNRVSAPYYRRVLEQLESLPNIASVTFTDTVPFLLSGYQADINLIEHGQTDRSAQTRVIGISDGYFATLGAKLIAGEDFLRIDPSTHEPSVIVSQSLAHHLGTDQSLLGQHVTIGMQPDMQRLRIVGVVSDMDTNLADLNDTKPFLAFVDFWQHETLQGYPALLIKTKSPVLDATAVRRVIERNGHEFVERMSNVNAEIDNALVENRFIAYVSGAFGVLALLLAAIGLFGLLSYQVANRTAEIGVRMALGARHSQIRSLILGEAIRLLWIGIVAGIALTFATQKLLASFLYGVTVYDPAILASGISVLTAAALVAATIPSQRAMNINPLEALRHD